MVAIRLKRIFFLTLLWCTLSSANWTRDALHALGSVASTAGDVVKGAATETLNVATTSLASGGAVSPMAVAELDYCRRLAAVPGGTMSLEYQRRCGNMAFTCQQVRMMNPQATMDPYCATVSGSGQMMGPWGGTTGAMLPGINTVANSQNTDPNKIGWSVPPPPPFGMMMGGMGGPPQTIGSYGMMPGGASGFGGMLADSMISRYMSGGRISAGQYGGYGGPGGYSGQTYSSMEEPDF